MRFVDFLIYLLKAQAETLQRLAAFFGEEEFLQILEQAGEILENNPPQFVLEPKWFGFDQATSNAYNKLEGTVKEFKLPAILEFHLWAYPFYRVLIESSIPLGAQFKDKVSREISHELSHDFIAPLDILVDEAMKQSQIWLQQLPIRPALSVPAEATVKTAWIRFRNQVLRSAGKRPIHLL